MRPSIALIATTLACSLSTAPPGEVPPGGTVLFVGNSLTYANDLPLMVQALGDSAGGARLEARTVAFPNANLEDHLAEGSALRAIRRGGWTTVVLQQGPSSLPENREQLRASTRTFADEIARVGARTALYAVWPTRARRQDFPAANESYALAAADVGGILFPVGEAWLAAWRLDESMPLYAADGLHPSMEGSYLAALVIVGRLTGRSPVGMPRGLQLANGARLILPESRAALLQQAAAEALR